MMKRKLTLGVAIAAALLMPIGLVSPALAEDSNDEPAVTTQTQASEPEQDPTEDPEAITDDDDAESPGPENETEPTDTPETETDEDSTEIIEEAPAPTLPNGSALSAAKQQAAQVMVTNRTKSTISVGNKAVFRGTTSENLVGKRVQLQVARDGAWVKLTSSPVATDTSFRVATIATKPGAFKYRLYVSATASTKATKSETFAYTVEPLTGESGVVEIFGKATLAHSPKSPVTMYKWGVDVRTTDCKRVKNWTWLGAPKERNRYAISVPEAGDYRVVITASKSPYAPWSGSSHSCTKAETVTAVAGERTRHDLSITARGGLYVTGKYSNQSHPAIFDRTGTREVDWVGTIQEEYRYYSGLPPFSYKVARQTVGDKVFAVFGTKSTDPAKGTSVRVYPGKATLVNFSEGTISHPKLFPVTSKLTISGNATPGNTALGETLQASVSKLPDGTNVTYEWNVMDDTMDDPGHIPGATESSYTVQASDLGVGGPNPPHCDWRTDVSVQVTLTKPGYVSQTMTTERLTLCE